MKKRIVSIILALMLLLSLTACAKDGGEIARESRNGVVRIFVEGLEGYYFGSGFGVGEVGEPTKYFVTNWHVVNPEGEYYGVQKAVRVWIMEDGAIQNGIINESRMIPCDVVYWGDSSGYPDVAILKAAEAPSDRVAMPLYISDKKDSVEVGETVYTLGYPAILDVLNLNTYDLNCPAAVEDVNVTSGIVSKYSVMSTFGNTKTIQIDARISGGNSGGPLINSKGEVVGINTYSLNDDSGNMAAFAVDISYVTEALDDYDIYYEGLGTNWMLIGIIGGIAALIVIVVVIIIAVSSKSKKKAAPAPVPAPTPSAAPAFTPAGQPPVQPPVSDGRPRLQCKAGAFVGKRFSLENSVRIGRDPAKNDLVFPANTQGVSGVHCVLMVDGNTVWLKDLGSTYGTYIAGGRRLAANEAVQLHMGDQFWLGSERELFVIAPKGGI